MRRNTPVAFALAVSLTASVRSEDWPCWRGPRGDGNSIEKNLPTRWSRTENIQWKVPIPGKGHSSPIVSGDRIFVTTCIEDKTQRVLLCLDRNTGETLWERVVLTAPLERRHNLNSCASSTPATDGKHVWTTFLDAPRMRVYCHDLQGNPVWERSPGEFHSVHGFCSSVILHGGKVIINGDQDAEAYIVAFDKTTGDEKWRIPRPNKMRSYCVPAIFHAGGRTQMVLSGSICVASYDPETGKQWWIMDGPTEQMVASIVLAQDTFFVTGGYPELHILGLPTDRLGKLTENDILWRTDEGVAYVPSPIACGSCFFVVSDRGTATCFEAKTGKVHWTKSMGRRHSASLVQGDGNIYFLSDQGECWVAKAGPRYEEVAVNRLEEECNASPAISGGQIFIRTGENLYAVGKKGGATVAPGK